MLNKSVTEFTEALASKAAVPGGGGASALVGAIGIALGDMVGELTVGKKKYADVEEDVRALMARAQELSAAGRPMASQSKRKSSAVVFSRYRYRLPPL